MSDDATVYLIVGALYFVAAVGGYVWWSFTLAKVFERFDEKGWKAWVPLYNQYTLFQLGGVQPWIAFLFVVPIAGVVAYVMYVLAAHRINMAYGKSGAFTAIAALFPPVWTTLLSLSKENPSSVAEAVLASRGLETAPAMLSTSTRSEGVPMVNEPTPAPAPYAVQPGSPLPPAEEVPAAPAFLGSDFPPAPPTGAPVFDAPPPPPMGSPVFDAPPPPPTAEPGAGIGLPANGPDRDAPAAFTAPAPHHGSPFLGGPDTPPSPPAPMTGAPAPALDFPSVAPAAGAAAVGFPPAPVAPAAASAPGDDGALAAAPAPASSPAASPVKVHNPWAPSAAETTAPPQATLDPVTPVPVAGAPTPAAAPATPVSTPAPIAPAGGAVTPAVADDDEYGETIIVDRRPRITWTLSVDEAGDLPLTHGTVLLGRKPQSDDVTVQALAIPDPTRTLSKVHARLERTDEQWTITDLNSTNGVMLVAEDGTETLLSPGTSAPVTGRFVLGKVGMSIGFTS